MGRVIHPDMEDVAQLARRVMANVFTPLPGAGAVEEKSW